MPSRDPQSRVLGERFDIVSQLGAGAMGEVYRARDRARGQDIALKVLSELDATALMRFKNEFRALHDVQHPNLVAVHELHEDRGTWFFTMQFVDGVDFLTWVDGNEGRLRDALAQVARALHHLHVSGLVHRDVKPSNIRVTSAGRAMLLDFGLVAPTWSPGEAAGTPAFMSPEQIEGDVSPAADWYAFGVLLFRALTNRFPFSGPPEEAMRMKRERAAPRVCSIAPQAPPDLAGLADALLARSAEARPRGQAVLASLQARAEPTRFAGKILVGRERELQQLHELWTERMRGVSLAVSIAGESGIGKTTLLDAFAEEIEQTTSAWVLRGRCRERESVPYKGFDEVLADLATRVAADDLTIEADGWAPILVQAFPAALRPMFGELEVSRDIRGFATAARVSNAARGLFAEVTRHQPLVVIIDDLQWAGHDTLDLIRGIVDPPLANVLLIVGVRDHGDIAPSLDLRKVTLGPLSPMETSELVRIVASELGTAPDVDTIAREAAGHPLFAAQLARRAAATGNVGVITFDASVAGVVNGLGADAQRVMTILSIAHVPIRDEVLARACEQTSAAVRETIRALHEARLVVTSGVGSESRLEPAHDRMRRVFTADLGPEERRVLNTQLARALESELHVDPHTLALHWSEAGDAARAADHAMRAAEQAEVALAFHRAAMLYKWVSELDPSRREAQMRYAEALAQVGLGVDAADAYLASASSENGLAAIDLRRRAMQQLLLMGHSERALQLFDELARELAIPNPTRTGPLLIGLLRRRAALRFRKPVLPPPPTHEPDAHDLARIDVLWDAAAGLGMSDPLRGCYYQTLGLQLAFRVGDHPRLARAILGDVPYRAATGKPTRRMADFVALADLAAERSNFTALATLCRGVFAFFYGQWGECHAQLDRTERLMLQQRPRLVREGVGPAQLLDMTRRLEHVAAIYLGRLRDVRQRAPDLLRDAVMRNDVASATHLRTGIRSLVHLAFDDLETATRYADDGIRPWLQRRIGVPHFMDVQARTNIDLYTHRGVEAHRRMVEWFPQLSRANLFRVRYLHITMLDARGRAALAAAAQEPSRRSQLMRDALKCATKLRALDNPWAAAFADALLAGIAFARGDDASAHLTRAASAFERAEMPVYAANARLVAGDTDARSELVAAGIVNVDAYSQLLLPR